VPEAASGEARAALTLSPGRDSPRGTRRLSRFVNLSNERTLEPVRKDCSFAEKKQPQLESPDARNRSGRGSDNGRWYGHDAAKTAGLPLVVLPGQLS